MKLILLSNQIYLTQFHLLLFSHKVNCKPSSLTLSSLVLSHALINVFRSFEMLFMFLIFLEIAGYPVDSGFINESRKYIKEIPPARKKATVDYMVTIQFLFHN